jgi:hypothetical protein
VVVFKLAATIPNDYHKIFRGFIGLAALIKCQVLLDWLIILADPKIIKLPHGEWLAVLPVEMVSFLRLPLLFLSLLFALGIAARAAGATILLFLVYCISLDQQLYSNHLYLLIILLSLSLLGQVPTAGVLGTRNSRFLPAWPLWLAGFQISVVYLFAALSKFNLSFISGGILANSWVKEGIFAVPEQYKTPEYFMPLAISAVILELFLALAFWFPRYRVGTLMAGVLFHITIALTVAPFEQLNLVVFSLMMFAGYSLLVKRAAEIP